MIWRCNREQAAIAVTDLDGEGWREHYLSADRALDSYADAITLAVGPEIDNLRARVAELEAEIAARDVTIDTLIALAARVAAGETGRRP